MCVTPVQTTIPHIVVFESINIMQRVVCVFFFCFFFSGVVYHYSVARQLCPRSFLKDEFLTHCCIKWEFLFCFCFYFFCPPVKADTGTKLVSVLGQDRQKVLLFPFLSFNFSTQRPERREGSYIYIFLKFLFMQHIAANHCCYFPTVSTEYGVNMKML